MTVTRRDAGNTVGTVPSRVRRIPVSQAVEELRGTLRKANSLAQALDARLVQAANVARRAAEVETELGRVKEDSDALALRLVEAERNSERLMNLYVATYQLHATLDPQDVQATIAEIAINLLGAERFALLLRDDDNEDYEVAVSEGLEEHNDLTLKDGRYVGGEPIVDICVEQGMIHIAPQDASGARAAVPLVVQGVVVGALVILKLLDHRAQLGADDREFLDLLSAHAASALLAARAYEGTQRKLRTLEGLVQLARGH